jgi:hypothetical protein
MMHASCHSSYDDDDADDIARDAVGVSVASEEPFGEKNASPCLLLVLVSRY